MKREKVTAKEVAGLNKEAYEIVGAINRNNYQTEEDYRAVLKVVENKFRKSRIACERFGLNCLRSLDNLISGAAELHEIWNDGGERIANYLVMRAHQQKDIQQEK